MQHTNIRDSLVKPIVTGVSRALQRADRVGQSRRNVDIVVSQSLQKIADSHDLLFPVAFVEMRRDCLKEVVLTKLEPVKAEPDPRNDIFTKRLSSLVDALRYLPPITISSAVEIALVADSYRGNLEPVEGDLWTGDVGSHFASCSSCGTRGRILSTVVRFTQARQCLELGTAYGLSSLFILERLRGEERILI